jgi:hypothetical protein
MDVDVAPPNCRYVHPSREPNIPGNQSLPQRPQFSPRTSLEAANSRKEINFPSQPYKKEAPSEPLTTREKFSQSLNVSASREMHEGGSSKRSSTRWGATASPQQAISSTTPSTVCNFLTPMTHMAHTATECRQ